MLRGIILPFQRISVCSGFQTQLSLPHTGNAIFLVNLIETGRPTVFPTPYMDTIIMTFFRPFQLETHRPIIGGMESANHVTVFCRIHKPVFHFEIHWGIVSRLHSILIQTIYHVNGIREVYIIHIKLIILHADGRNRQTSGLHIAFRTEDHGFIPFVLERIIHSGSFP